MASAKSKRRARKRRNPTAVPRAVASTRRDERVERQVQAGREVRRSERHLSREGERPPSPFGGLPVSEIGILVGGIALVIGFIEGGGPVLIVGVVIVVLAVLEVTGREHLSGYRSHTTLLAALPAVAVGSAAVALSGQRALLIVFAAPVFAGLFWLLRRRFAAARQARVTRRSAA